MRLGPTQTFSDGRIAPDDKGDLVLAVSHGGGQVRIDFGTHLNWLSMPPETARQFATLIEVHASKIERGET